MTTLIPNCFNCGRKHGGRYEPKNGVGLLCKKCKDKEIETLAHEQAHTELKGNIT